MSAFPRQQIQHQRSDRSGSFCEVRPIIPARGSGTLPGLFPVTPTHSPHHPAAAAPHSSVFPAGTQHACGNVRHRAASTAPSHPAFIKRKSDVGHSSTKWHLRLVQQQQQQNQQQQQFGMGSGLHGVPYDSPGRRSLSARISMSDVRSFSNFSKFSFMTTKCSSVRIILICYCCLCR